VYEVYWVFLPTLKGLEYSKLTLQRKSQDLKRIQKAFKDTSKGLETPIGTMSSHVQALEDGCENPAGLKDLDKMKSAVQGLTGIVTTINSELSLEGSLEKEQLSIGSLVEDVRRDLSHMIKENKAVIIDRSEHSLYVNRTEWKLLLQNLVSNAIKYRRDDIDPIVGIQSFTRRNELCISVSDNGMGIPAKDLARVFDYEFRAMNSKTRKGFGYGLSHCQSIVDRYNGKIIVDSKVNFGSTFTISIPMS
jgi:two-component system CheB/CheR fusion protein